MDWKLDKKQLLWLFLPISIYLLADMVRWTFTQNDITQSGNLFILSASKSLKTIARETELRYFVMIATTAFFVISSALSVLAVYDIWKRFGGRQFCWFLLMLPVMGCVTFFPLFLRGLEDFHFVYELYGFVERGSETMPYIEAVFEGPLLDLFNGKLLIMTQVALLVGIWAIMSGVISCLGYEGTDLNQGNPIVRLEQYLFAAAILMVSGLILIISVARWAGCIFEPGTPNYETYRNISNSMFVFAGLIFSMMSAAIYLPIRYQIKNKLGKYIISPASTGKPEQSFSRLISKVGVSDSHRDFYSYFLKISAPVIVAWVSAYIEFSP